MSARGKRGGDVRQRIAGERQVFPEVHGDVDGVGAQRHAEVAGESAAAQQLGQRGVELAVAGRVRKEYLDLQTRMAREQASPTRRACTCASTLARAPNTMGLSRVISCYGRGSNTRAMECAVLAGSSHAASRLAVRPVIGVARLTRAAARLLSLPGRGFRTRA